MQIADIITEAFERIGMFGEEVSGDMLNSATRSLNFMLLDWCADKSKEWAIDTISVAVPVGVSFINTLPGTYDILRMYIRENNTDTPMNALSREDYDFIGDKSTALSKPIQYFVDRSFSPPRIYLYPMSNTDGYTIFYTRVRVPTEYMDPSSDTGMNPYWANALASGLSSYLAQKYKPEIKSNLDADAQLAYRKASRADSSSTDFRLIPARRI